MLFRSERAKVRARADELILEEMTLREARKRVAKTQAATAKQLGIGQDSVSRIEQRGDMLVSTLRDYVAAIGGKVRLVVEFQGRPPVELKTLGRRRGAPQGRKATPAQRPRRARKAVA